MHIFNIDVMDGKGNIEVVVSDIITAARLQRFMADAKRLIKNAETELHDARKETS